MRNPIHGSSHLIFKSTFITSVLSSLWLNGNIQIGTSFWVHFYFLTVVTLIRFIQILMKRTLTARNNVFCLCIYFYFSCDFDFLDKISICKTQCISIYTAFTLKTSQYMSFRCIMKDPIDRRKSQSEFKTKMGLRLQ